jgi:hypothetical protein
MLYIVVLWQNICSVYVYPYLNAIQVQLDLCRDKALQKWRLHWKTSPSSRLRGGSVFSCDIGQKYGLESQRGPKPQMNFAGEGQLQTTALLCTALFMQERYILQWFSQSSVPFFHLSIFLSYILFQLRYDGNRYHCYMATTRTEVDTVKSQKAVALCTESFAGLLISV